MLFSQLSTDGSSIDPGLVLFSGSNIYPAMFEITGEIPEPLFEKARRLSPAEYDRPSLEVRCCGDGHPPVTKRERVIRLNGIGGVIFVKRPELNRRFRPFSF